MAKVLLASADTQRAVARARHRAEGRRPRAGRGRRSGPRRRRGRRGRRLGRRSAITGESAPVIREAGGDRSAVTGGTRVLSDWIKVRITAEEGSTFLDRMIALVEGAERQKTPNEIALKHPAGRPDADLRARAVVTIPSFAPMPAAPSPSSCWSRCS
jgi:hypothetical protein